MPNTQPGGPGYPFSSGSSPLTCLVWEALPVAYATASIALGFVWPRKLLHYVKVGIPSRGLIWHYQAVIGYCTEDSGLPGCNTVSLGDWFLMFWRNSSWSTWPFSMKVYIYSNHKGPITQQRGIKSQKTGIFNCIAVNASKLAAVAFFIVLLQDQGWAVWELPWCVLSEAQ